MMDLKVLMDRGQIRQMSPDKFKAESLIKAAFNSAEFSKMNPINDKTATGVFREMHEAFHQLGNAKWWLLGYEAISHEASVNLLISADIENSFKLVRLDRFRRIRNDATYRGFIIKPEQAEEIVSLWDEIHSDLIKWIRK